MYCYTPPKKRTKLKNTALIISGIIIVAIGYFGDTRHTINYRSIQTLWNPIAVAVVNNPIDTPEPEFNPCDLKDVYCEGEDQNEVEIADIAIIDIIKLQFGQHWRIAYAVLQAENTELDTTARYTNKDIHRSIDRGLFQINNYWHAEVSDKCAHNIKCNIAAAHRISKGGTDWHEWSTFKAGRHLKYM